MRNAPAPSSSSQGYMPKRGEFEQEYDCEAEELLADMEFFEGEDPEETRFKEEVMLMYN